MGMMPPYDPFQDTALAWVIARVASITPSRPTWSTPARVVLQIEEVLRGAPPTQVEVQFGPPREAGQEQFYLVRGLGPPPWSREQEAELERQRAEMGARPIEVPDVGERIGVWLSMLPSGEWEVPTLRTIGGATPMPMRSRWIAEPHLAALRAHLPG